MSELTLQNRNRYVSGKAIGRITLLGLLIRGVLLIIMLALKDQVRPYYIIDDIMYEETARQYLLNAKSVIDVQYLDMLLKGYMQPFWPVVMCVSAGIFKTIYVGRVINIILSAACIPVIYKTTLLLSGKGKTALLAGKLFAFLPVTVMTSCFPIKDIYLTWAVLYAFYVFLLFCGKTRVGFFRVALCVAALAGVYFTRGAVTELMVIFFAVLWINALWKKKKYIAAACVVLLAVATAFLYGANAIDAFSTKIEDYGGYNEASEGGLSMLQMKNAGEFYKLPFAYFFATLQPMTMNYFVSGENLWLRLLRLFNISIYPVAIANAIYIFMKKHNTLYWLCGAVMYCAIISMVLGVSRHYLFLLPLEIINCALCFDKKSNNTNILVLLGTLGLVALVALYSLIAVL